MFYDICGTHAQPTGTSKGVSEETTTGVHRLYNMRYGKSDDGVMRS